MLKIGHHSRYGIVFTAITVEFLSI